MTLQFPAIPVSGGSGVAKYIDLSQCASLVNRRFYRQGINWAVAGIKILSLDSTGAPSGIVSVSKLPNTWVLANSWEKSMRAWSKMNREALAEAPSVRPKFLDFKIYADAGHHTAGYAANLLPQGYTAGEWVASKFVIPDNSVAGGVAYDREVIGVGPNYPGAGASGINAISMIEGYAASRGLPDVLDPNAPADASDADGTIPQNWMSALFNDGTEQDADVLEDMISENNLAPYPFENDGTHTDTMYPNGANQAPGLQIHDQEFITGTTIGGTTRIKGGNFPCGLVSFTLSNTNPDVASQADYYIYIDLVPGNHRGYLCESMTEM